MQKFGQETPDKPCIPSLEIRKLRAKLILEEALETIGALGFYLEHAGLDDSLISVENTDIFEGEPKLVNLVSIADGLADLHYVAYCGTAVACGLDMEPIFKEVDRSNNSKIWKEEEIYTNRNSKAWHHERIGDTKFFLVSDIDGKVVKPVSYSPANLQPIIEQQLKD